MIVKVLLLAFGRSKETRDVDLGDWDVNAPIAKTLAEVYRLGQNEFQPQRHPSVSMGDVAVIDGKNYLCVRVGWRLLTDDEFDRHLLTPRIERSFSDLLDESNV